MSRTFQYIYSALFLLLFYTFSSTTLAKQVYQQSFPSKPFDHTLWAGLLKRSTTSNGKVFWRELKLSPERLNQYLDQLAWVSPQQTPTYFKKPLQKKLYWINAHNALMLRLVLDHYPEKPMPEQLINTRYRVAGSVCSLDTIRMQLVELDPGRDYAQFLSVYTASHLPLVKVVSEAMLLKPYNLIQ